jgi:hypothetical protein
MILLIASCNSKGVQNAQVAQQKIGEPCSIRIEVSSSSDHVEMYAYLQGEQKSLTIDKTIDQSESQKEIIDLSSTIGAKLEIHIKTNDSYGPVVNVKIFVNEILMIEEEDSYKIDIAETISLPQNPKGV